MVIKVHESNFESEDPYNRGYSLAEIDFFTKPYALSLRKNLSTKKYELYKRTEAFQTNVEEKDIVEVFNDLQKALNRGREISIRDSINKDDTEFIAIIRRVK